MALASVSTLVEALRGQGLLATEQFDEIERDLQHRHADARALAADLLRRNWLTPFQVNQLLQERGIPLVLGGYVLLERIGEGGMGQVFKARHLRLGRYAAIKIIRPELLTQAAAVQRFEREARAAAQLNHTNIVAVYDFSEAKGLHFLVMEYVQGIDLSRRLEESGPLPVLEACEYIRQTAIGLQHAHERGLVHRDIKPHNLLIADCRTTIDDLNEKSAIANHQSAILKILDMGLARGPGTSGEDGITREGVLVGTLDYLAPEQARNSKLLDARSDLYSLGCTFYHLLTGKPPYPDTSGLEKLLQHQQDEPAALEKLRPDVPPQVAAIVRKLMAKKLDERYALAAEVADALGQYLASNPLPTSMVATRRPSTMPVALMPTEIVSQPNAETPLPGTAAAHGLQQQPAAKPSWRRRLLYVAGGFFLCLVLLAIFNKKKPEEEVEDDHGTPGTLKDDPFARALPEHAAALLRVEVKTLLAHPWIFTYFRAPLRDVVRGKGKLEKHVPNEAEHLLEKIDRLAVVLGPDAKSGDLWLMHGERAAITLATLAGPAVREPNGRDLLHAIKEGPFPWFIAIDTDLGGFSDHKELLLALHDRGKDTEIPSRPAALLAPRQASDTVWLSIHRDVFTRLPDVAGFFASDWTTLRDKTERIEARLALGEKVHLQLAFIARAEEESPLLEEVCATYVKLVRDSPFAIAAFAEDLIPILPLMQSAKLTRTGRRVVVDCEIGTDDLLAKIEELKRMAKWKSP